MKIKYKLIAIGVVVVLISIAIYWGINYLYPQLTVLNDNLTEQPENIERDEDFLPKMGKSTGEKQEDVAEEFPNDMSEGAVMNAIHEMTHQKVHAESKWGKLQITPERVEQLLEVVQANDYEHKELYLDILEEWNAGRFDNSVSAHNQIWTLQDGTIGKAIRLLTDEEEEKYIQENFK